MLTGGVAGGVGGRTGDDWVLDGAVFDAGVETALDIFFFRFLVCVGVGGTGDTDFATDGVLGEDDLENPDPFSMCCLA